MARDPDIPPEYPHEHVLIARTTSPRRVHLAAEDDPDTPACGEAGVPDQTYRRLSVEKAHRELCMNCSGERSFPGFDSTNGLASHLEKLDPEAVNLTRDPEDDPNTEPVTDGGLALTSSGALEPSDRETYRALTRLGEATKTEVVAELSYAPDTVSSALSTLYQHDLIDRRPDPRDPRRRIYFIPDDWPDPDAGGGSR